MPVEPSGNKQCRILVVLGESERARELVGYLEQQDFEVLWSREGHSAFEILDREPVDALIFSLHERRIDGFRVLQISRQRNPEICAIAVVRPEDIEQGIEAMRQGASDFQWGSLNLEKVKAVLERGVKHQRLVDEVSDLHRRLDERFRFGGIVRRSSRWLSIYSQIEQVAQARASVLITGPTGAGKGEVAKAIHQQSRRRERDFIELNCAALPEGIVESELFGHEKGAFTTAVRRHHGRFEQADQGTLFLDEVGDIPPATQVKLLRVIQDGHFERVGGGQTRKVDVRLIAATNKNLEELVESGVFRADLFYRLQVVTIEVPPLRHCKEDIPILIDEFIQQFAEENSKAVTGITPGALETLLEYDWPGNVRELKNCIEGMVVMSPRQGLLDITDIPPHIGRSGRRSSGRMHFRVGMTMQEVEKLVLQETLKATSWDRRRTAEILGMGLSTLYRKEKEFGLREKSP